MNRAIALYIEAFALLAGQCSLADSPVTIQPPGEALGPVRVSSFEADTREGRLLAVASGTVTVTGDYDAGIVVLAGDLRIGKDAMVTGPITVVGGSVDRAPGARVEKEITELHDAWVHDAVSAFYGISAPPVEAPGDCKYVRASELTIARDDVVKGTIVIAWGTLTVEGRVEGSVVALGSAVNLGPECEVMGDIVQVTTDDKEPLERDDSAKVRGRVITVAKPPLAASAPPVAAVAAEAPEAPEAPPAPKRAEVPESELTTVHSGPIMGGSITIRKGQRAEDLAIFGGSVTVENGGAISGDAAVFGGSLTLDGGMSGDAVVMGGSVRIGPTGAVKGDLVCIGGAVDIAKGAEVRGDVMSIGGSVRTEEGADVPIVSGGVHAEPNAVIGAMEKTARALASLSHAVFTSLLLFGLTLLIATAWPTRVQVVTDCVKLNVGRALSTGLGVLVALALLALVVTLATCGIGGLVAVPVVALSVVLAYTLGWAAIAGVVGSVVLRKGRLGVTPLLGYVAAGAGVLAAAKIASTVLTFLQTPLYLAFLALAVIGIGAVFETQWGTREPGDESLLRQWAAGRLRRRGGYHAWSFRNGPPPPPPPDDDDWRPGPPEA